MLPFTVAVTAVSSAPTQGHDYTMAWMLVAVCLFAGLLAAAGAVILSVHHRRQRVPRYRRHSPTPTHPND